ncbi:uncharacterized protein LOC132273105 [Cornus florida]|uniref:uncharacterized protein LOC132273105 n=1 Tax=Cornus florida TaxID=4283 RepID=UPI0028A140FD|nr:uncharacterized protein LOC132273105 [Cornus florida]
MLQDMVHPPEQLQIQEISSPFGAQFFEFCDPELFSEALQDSEVASTSNYCHEENSSYTPNFSFPPNTNQFTRSTNTTTTTPITTTNDNTCNNLSLIFDSPENIENDISASIDFSPFLTAQQDQLDLSSLQSQIPVINDDVVMDGLSQFPPEPIVPLIGPPPPPPPPLSAVYEEECISPMPSYARLNTSSPSCSFLDQTIGPYLPGNQNAALSTEYSGILVGGMPMSTELQPQELEFQGDTSGIFWSGISSTELQALANESHHASGGGSSTPLASEISSMEDSTFKVAKLSVEQRKEKIHRYMKKRNERNFSKKIKYACRKTLADSRPRVRGRFAKNDEFGDTPRTTCSNQEEDTDEDVVVKEEDDFSSNIFAHINGMNSFKCKYPIQSWI